MKKPQTVENLENLGRIRLSKNFFFRDFLYSEVANFYGKPNIPDRPELAIEVGKRLCEELLEPLQATFGRITIRSGYRSKELNLFCNEKGHNCGKDNAASHTWDELHEGKMGAMACIVVNWYLDRYEQSGDFRPLAWWVHDHLPYSSMYFFPKLCAFNLGWYEQPSRRIDSYIPPKGCLTKPGMDNHTGDHSEWYQGLPKLIFT
ncbi:hypothetical protein [Chroococcidiopsis sp.]|uniref:hypothetical protein n=1 Tax=Chroococcidiopsis sp. TaxID=3088168 RepID=UPI003F3E2FBC